MSISAGTRLGPYEIVAPIGAGGMGEVWRARDSRLGRFVAVKVLAPHVAEDAGRIARFEREARLSSSLNHPAIVTIHEFAHSDGIAYIAMELVDGKSLRALIASGPVPARKLITIGTQIADGLAAAHKIGVIHRDLKPENVMLTAAGGVKILDFGLARIDSSTSRDHNASTDLELTGGHQIMGTAAYMSPEQASGAALDFRSDQFSLGTILHEMATGRNPFRRANALETLAAVHSGEVPSLEASGRSLPEAFAWIVERCLAKDPEERYASTHDLARDLKHLSESAFSGNAPPAKRRRRFSTPLFTGLAGGATIALAVLLAWPHSPAPAVRHPTYVALHMPEVNVPLSETVLPVAISPDGRRVVVGGSGSGRRPGLWIRNFETTEATLIPGTERGYAPAFSPDGTQLAFFADGKLKIVPLSGGAAKVVCEVRDIGSPSWTSASLILFAQGGGIFSVPPSGGAPRRLTTASEKGPDGFHLWPELLPDLEHFLYLAIVRQPGTSAVQSFLMAGALHGGPAKKVASISSRAVFHEGKLLYARDGALLAQPFDVETLSLTGEPISLVDRLYYYQTSGMAAFAVSKSGTIVYGSPKTESRVTWMDRNGVQGPQVMQALLGREPGRLSPDGQQYAIGVIDPKLGTADLWSYDLSRGTASRITYEPSDDTRPVWSADGQSLFFRSDAVGPPDIFRRDLQSQKTQLVFHGDEFEEPADVSPDGKRLLFEQVTPESKRDIAMLSLDGLSARRDLVRTPFHEAWARFSPDGRWIAFASEISGRYEIYIIGFPEPGSPIRVSSAGGNRPRWRGDGLELFYLVRGEIMSVDVTSGAGTMHLGEPRFLFRSALGIEDFEVMRDGKRFLVRTSGVEWEPPQVQLVLDAFAAR